MSINGAPYTDSYGIDGEPYTDKEEVQLRNGTLLTDVSAGEMIGYCNKSFLRNEVGHWCYSKVASINDDRLVTLYSRHILDQNERIYKEGKQGRQLDRIRLWIGKVDTAADMVLVDIKGNATIYDVSNDGDDSVTIYDATDDEDNSFGDESMGLYDEPHDPDDTGIDWNTSDATNDEDNSFGVDSTTYNESHDPEVGDVESQQHDQLDPAQEFANIIADQEEVADQEEEFQALELPKSPQDHTGIDWNTSDATNDEDNSFGVDSTIYNESHDPDDNILNTLEHNQVDELIRLDELMRSFLEGDESNDPDDITLNIPEHGQDDELVNIFLDGDESNDRDDITLTTLVRDEVIIVDDNPDNDDELRRIKAIFHDDDESYVPDDISFATLESEQVIIVDDNPDNDGDAGVRSSFLTYFNQNCQDVRCYQFQGFITPGQFSRCSCQHCWRHG